MSIEIDKRVDFLEERIRRLEERLAANPDLSASTQVRSTNEKTFLHSIDKLAAEIKLSDRPQFFVGAIALNAIDLPSIFENRGLLVDFFDNPDHVRENGFAPYTVEGRAPKVDAYGRTATFNSQIRHLSRDGKFSALFMGDDSFLGWALRQETWGGNQGRVDSEWRINSIVLTEATYECVLMTQKIFNLAVPPVTETQFFMGYRNMLWQGKGPRLLKGKADRNMFMREQLPSDKGEHIVSIVSPASESVGRTTFRLVSDVYHSFGVMDEFVPYSVLENEERVIDPAEF